MNNDDIIKKYGKTLSESNYKLDFKELFAKTELNDMLNAAREDTINTLFEGAANANAIRQAQRAEFQNLLKDVLSRTEKRKKDEEKSFIGSQDTIDCYQEQIYLLQELLSSKLLKEV